MADHLDLPDTETGNARLKQLFRHLLLLEADMNAYRLGSRKSASTASRV